LSLDAAGTLYTAPYKTSGYDGLAEIPASNYNGAPIADLDSTDTLATAGALGPDGALYVGDGDNVDKIDRSQGAVNFGNQTAGVTASAQTVSMYNGGNQNLTLSNFALTSGGASGFALQAPVSNPCANGMILLPGTLCNVAVTWTPPTAGTFSGAITFTTNTLNTSSTNQTVALSGTVLGINVTASPNPLAFGNQGVNTTSGQQFITLTNSGVLRTATIALPLPTLSGFTLGIGTCNVAIAPNGGTCQLTATFSPTLAQAYSVPVTLTADSNAFTTQNVSFTLTGTGTPPPAPIASLSTTPIAFTNQVVGSTSEPLSAVLSNSGNAPLAISGITVGGTNPSDFTVLTTGTNVCGATLAAGAICNIYVTFTPASATSFSATLQVADNGGSSPQTLALSGTGVTFVSNVGTAEAAQAVTVNITTAGTLNSIQVLTQAAANLDFNYAPGGGCTTDTAYTVGQSCTVNVVFTPQYSGSRYGAVVLTNSSGVVLGTTYLPGTGVGPQLAFYLSNNISSYTSASGSFNGVAVDASGDVFIAGSTDVTEIPAGCLSATCYISIGGGNLSNLQGMAVDGSGNLYVTNSNPSLVMEIPQGCTSSSCAITLGGGFTSPYDVAVDGNGNVYVADSYNNAVKMMPPGCLSSSCVTTLGGGFFVTQGIAVDGKGNVYVADDNLMVSNSGSIKEMPPGCLSSACVTTLLTNLPDPRGLAVDAAGDVYFTQVVPDDAGAYEMLAVGGSIPASPTVISLITPFVGSGVALDGPGNVYLVSGASLFKRDVVDPPGQIFETATNVGLMDTTDDPQKVPVQNIGNASLTFTGITPSTNFQLDAGTTTCSTSTALAEGITCLVGVDFAPTAGGTLNGTVTLTDNNLNVAGTTQAIPVSGTGLVPLAPAASLSPNPLAFGGQVYEITSPAQAVVLSNTGGSALTGITPTLTGTNPTSFAITTGANACSTTLAAGSSCNIWITFTPINAGNLQATLSVADNASPSPQTVTLAGTYDYFYSRVGTALAAQPVSVYITTAGTLSSIQVLTQGYAGLDFSEAAGGTCTTGTTYTVGQLCTVNVIFKPLVPGARPGGVLLTDALNNPLGEAYLPGTGQAGEIVYSIGVQSTLPSPTYASNYSAPSNIAVDASGNVYVADTLNSVVSRLLWNGTSYGTPFKLPFTNLDQPEAVAVDGVGNVFVADTKSFRILELPWRGPPGFGNQIVLDSSGLPDPDGIAVDYEGNLFFSDGSNDKVYEMPWTGNGYGAPTILTAATGLHTPMGLAVDSSQNLYIADSGDNQVVELPRTNSGYTSETVVDTGLNFPEAVAVDANGDLYIANTNAGTVVELTSTFGSFNTPFTLDFSGLGTSNGMALDSSGNIYVSDGTKNNVVKLNVSIPPSLSFASTNVGSTSSNSPQTVTVWNIGNGDVTIQSASYPTDFPKNTSDKNLCNSDDGIGGGASCDVSVNFTPTTIGLLSEDVVLTDNNLNVSGATQSIAVSGTAAGQPAPTINWTPASPITYGTALGSGDFAATASSSDTNVSADGAFAYYVTSVGGTAATASTVLPGGSDTLCVQWTPSSSFTSQYSSASLCVPIQVNPASTTISWTPASPIISPATLGSGQFNASASAGSTSVTSDGTLTYYINVVGGTVANSSTVLPAGANTVCVQWTPSSSFTADYNSSQTCASITVNAPTATLTPNPVAFGNQAVGTTSAAQVATLQNTGNATLDISGITIGGTNASDFAIGTGSNACGSTLAAGASCPIYVTFSPTSASSYSATLSVADNAIAAGGTSGNTSQLNITYFTIAENDMDGGVLCCGVSTNYVLSGLGPDGLPVYNPSATATSGSIFAPHDRLANNEITWWSPTLNNGGAGGVSDVVETGTAVVSLPFANNSFFAPNGTGTNDSSAFQAAILSGNLNAPTSEQISFSIASDDMAFLYLDGVNVCDDGGVHGATAVPCTTSTISAGTHSLELFYVDLDPSQAVLNFSITSSGVTTIPGSGSPQTVALTGTGITGTVINWTPSTPITYLSTLGNSQLNATAFFGATNISSDGTFTYYVTSVGGTVATSSTVLPGGSDTLCVQWAPSSSYTSQYSSASLCSPITVNAAATSISWSPSSATIIASTGPTAGQFDATAVAGETNVTADGTITYHLSTAGGTPISVGATLSVGPATICAVWAPSSGYALDYNGSSTCQNFTVINTQPTTTTVAANANPVFSTNSVTFTATVTPTSGTIVPTGTVTFLDGTTVIGTGTLSASGSGASAVAKLTLTTLPAGSQAITASYPGDTNNQASTTATLTEVVEDFSIVATGSTSSTIEPGATATFTFTVSPVSPATTFPAAITLTAAGLPTGATYSFSPASIASGAGSTPLTLTVTTPITALARNQSPAQGARWPVMALALLLLPLAGKFRRAGRRLSRMLSLLLLFAAGVIAAAALNGCGGVASGYFGQAQATSTITVTGTSGSLNHSASVSLTVE
jgi:sugar lactone lactonase YvrE